MLVYCTLRRFKFATLPIVKKAASVRLVSVLLHSVLCASRNRVVSEWKETVAYSVGVAGMSGHAGLLLWAPSEFHFTVTLMSV